MCLKRAMKCVVCHMKDLPGFSQDQRMWRCWLKEDQFTGDPIQRIRLVDPLLLLFGQPRETIGIEIISQWWWHRLISILYESSSGCCATRWCKMHIYTSVVVDEFFDKLQMIWVKQI